MFKKSQKNIIISQNRLTQYRYHDTIDLMKGVVTVKLEIYELARGGTGRITTTTNMKSRFNMVESDLDTAKLVQTLIDDEAASYLWNIEYEDIPENDKAIMNIFYPSVKENVTLKTKMPNKLVSQAKSWCLTKKELTTTCTRCGGDGNFSYNHRDGTRCFKCNGNGYALPRITKKWLERAEAEFKKYKLRG